MAASFFSSFLLLTPHGPSSGRASEPWLPPLSLMRLFSPSLSFLGRKVKGLRPKGLRGKSLSLGLLTQATSPRRGCPKWQAWPVSWWLAWTHFVCGGPAL